MIIGGIRPLSGSDDFPFPLNCSGIGTVMNDEITCSHVSPIPAGSIHTAEPTDFKNMWLDLVNLCDCNGGSFDACELHPPNRVALVD